ncbi:MAG: response regulator [Candidatus Mariimomonas ferrooxydans]
MKKTILIVDNDESTCRSLSKALSDKYITCIAFNGKEALNILSQNKDIKLILTDIMMPEMDGIELIEKARFTNKNINMIVITGYSSVESAVTSMRKGACDYFAKPVDLNRLETSIENALEK